MASGATSRLVHKLFVGNLPWTVGNNELKKYFSQFGNVSSARVLFNRETGMSKHFGFIELNDKSVYEKIINKLTHKLEGKTIVVRHVPE